MEIIVQKEKTDQKMPPSDDLSLDADRLDMLDIFLILARRRKLICTCTAIFILLGGLLCLVLKPNFTATALILPPQQQSSSSALLSQLGSLTSISGSAGLGLKTPADMYIGFLQSRTISDGIISKFQLQTLYNQKKLQDTRAVLKAHTLIQTGKDGLIEISVTDHDPHLASDMANAYVDGLHELNANLAISEAAQRRVFFDQQLDGERKALVDAEEALRLTQQKTGLIQLSGQAEMIIRTIAQLRAEIASREVQLQSIRAFATDENPDVTRLQGEISTMRRQLATLENDQQIQTRPGNITVPSSRVPEDSLEYARKFREVKYHETLVDLLSRQFEAARIDEAKSVPLIQVVDHAIPPDRKSGPKRLFILMGFAIFGFSLSSGISFLESSVARARKIPSKAVKLQDLQSHLWRS